MNNLEFYMHLVWSTQYRQPLITPHIERAMYRQMEGQAINLGCTVLAINGMPDHVHMLLVLPAVITLAQLIKQIKGNSSHFANKILQTTPYFKWQDGYGAFSISRWDTDKIRAYIERQKQHHAANSIQLEWEATGDDL